MPVRLALDYDGISRENVEDDVKALLKRFPQLRAKYKIEPSQTPTCWHVIFPLSEFKTFEEAADAAEQSKCDKDWLALSRRYKVFGIRTGEITKLRGRSKAVAIVQPQEKKRHNPPSDQIPSPIVLVLKPFDSQDLKRLIKLSEAMDDPVYPWLYKVEMTLARPEGQLLIGCKDRWQAERRVKFLESLGIVFTSETRS